MIPFPQHIAVMDVFILLAAILGALAVLHLKKKRLGTSNKKDLHDKSSIKCPNCKANMRVRTATKGRKKGRKFWGCIRYPECKGIRKR